MQGIMFTPKYFKTLAARSKEERETILVTSYYDNLISILHDKSPSNKDVLANVVKAFFFSKHYSLIS